MTQGETMVKITLDAAGVLVNRTEDLHWDGWTIVHESPNPLGWARKDGVWLSDKWGVAKRYPPQDDGMYHIPVKLWSTT
jgi:hypothetical protein